MNEDIIIMQEDGVETAKDNSDVEEHGDVAKDSYAGTEKSSITQGIDHFKNEESDPLKTNAMSKFFLHNFLQIIVCISRKDYYGVFCS